MSCDKQSPVHCLSTREPLTSKLFKCKSIKSGPSCFFYQNALLIFSVSVKKFTTAHTLLDFKSNIDIEVCFKNPELDG